jgi:hypothetical protein
VSVDSEVLKAEAVNGTEPAYQAGDSPEYAISSTRAQSFSRPKRIAHGRTNS